MSHMIGEGANIIAYARGGDFRLEAAAASAALLDRWNGNNAQPIDPQDAPGSLCVVVSDAASSTMMSRLRQVATACGWGGCGAIIVALSLFGVAVAVGMPELVIISLVLCVLGLILQFIDLYWRIAVIRSTISARAAKRCTNACGRAGGGHGGGHGGAAACISLEDASTFLRIKPIGEDVAMLFCDRDRRRLRIEGFNYRYFIRSDDVARVRVRRVPGSCSTEIRYRIGTTTELAIVLSEYPANPIEFLQVLVSFRSRLYRRIVAAIGTGGAAPATHLAVPADEGYTLATRDPEVPA